MKRRKVDISIKGVDGNIIFERKQFEVPEHFSDMAARIIASRYAAPHENSFFEIVDRVVDKIVDWGKKDGYFNDQEGEWPDDCTRDTIHCSSCDEECRDKYTDWFEFKENLKDILLNQRAAFNSPVWFNLGLESHAQQASACQPGDELINTDKGLISIKDIVELKKNSKQVFVYNYDRGLTEVVAVKENGLKEVFKITTYSGHTVKATGDHLVRVSFGKDHQAFKSVLDLEIDKDKLIWSRQIEDISPTNCCSSDYEIDKASLIGWIQTDGYCGQPKSNTSFVVELETINQDEYEWATSALRGVFGKDIHFNIIQEETIDQNINYKRCKLYGKKLEEFCLKYELEKRKTLKKVPEYLYTANLDVVSSYLKSIFQADGYVRLNQSGNSSTGIGLQSISKQFIEGIQRLLGRLRIFSRITEKKDNRPNRHDGWCLSINPWCDMKMFQEIIGFVSKEKQDKLNLVLKEKERNGLRLNSTKRLQIKNIESIGLQEVYDIQTNQEEYVCSNICLHNCYILPVDDSLEDILEQTVREGKIFKWGSGCGTNVSKLRGSNETLSTGGKSSGPISFMRTWDKSAGQIRSGGTLRRSAKLISMDVDHPDIESFVDCKYKEEQKKNALIAAGVPDQEANNTVDFQNTNHSVAVTDEFMRAAVNNKTFAIRNRSDKQTCRTINAKDLLMKIAERAYQIGDPGLQFIDTMNKDNPVPNTGRIECSNPCGEFTHISYTSCNLASMNLLKYVMPDGVFDDGTFRADIRTMITAMDIICGNADYPLEEVREKTLSVRPLGLGYSNLGAALIAMGESYSRGGAEVAQAITALMTQEAVKQSLELAKKLGPFPEFENNVEEFVDLCKRKASIVPSEEIRKYGLRNSQVTLLAPTGTIGFLMDCDTFGVEPLFSRSAVKTLADGSKMDIIPKCILSNKCKESDTKEILKTANELTYREHIDMLAAVQPYLFGAISKTVNLPKNSKPKDVFNAYVYAWENGLKGITVYVDGSKAMQPLTDTDKEEENVEEVPVQPAVKPIEGRIKLPDTRSALNHKFNIAGHEGYVTVGMYANGAPGEIFIRMNKQGSTLSGIMDSFAVAISLAIQYGVPLGKFVDKFKAMKFEPAGITTNPDIPICCSIVDYIFRFLEANFIINQVSPLDYLEESYDDEEDDMIEEEIYKQEKKELEGGKITGDLCSICGGSLVAVGTCSYCSSCGESSGCS